MRNFLPKTCTPMRLIGGNASMLCQYIYIYFRLKCCGKIDYKAGEDVTGPTSSVEHDLLFLKTYM